MITDYMGRGYAQMITDYTGRGYAQMITDYMGEGVCPNDYRLHGGGGVHRDPQK